LSTRSPIRSGLILNLGLRGEKSATDNSSYDIAKTEKEKQNKSKAVDILLAKTRMVKEKKEHMKK
jgi:hypothetical protein